MPPPVVLRPPAWQRAVWVVALGAFAVALLALATTGGWGWLGLPAGCATGFAAARSWLLRVEVASDGLVVVNWLRTHGLEGDAVDGVVHDRGVEIRLRDGGRMAIDAFGEPPGTLPFIVRRNEWMAATLQQHIRRGR